MHAVLLLSAKHLACLFPGNSQFRQASLFHLSELLPLYRQEVAEPLSIENADSVMATTFLLQYYAWSDVEGFNIRDPHCFVRDQLFALPAGIRETFRSAFSLLSTGRSIFSESTAYQPRYSVQNAARKCIKPPSHFQRYFCHVYQQENDNSFVGFDKGDPQIHHIPSVRLECQHMSINDSWHVIAQAQDPLLVGFLDASVRLSPICSIASEVHATGRPQTAAKNIGQGSAYGHVPDERFLLSTADLARYIFSWPMVSSPGVISLLECKDKGMIFLLYQYYKAITLVLPTNYWWAHQRAQMMISVLEEHFAQSTLDPPALELALSEDLVARASHFALEVNERWRQWCRNASSSMCCVK